MLAVPEEVERESRRVRIRLGVGRSLSADWMSVTLTPDPNPNPNPGPDPNPNYVTLTTERTWKIVAVPEEVGRESRRVQTRRNPHPWP